LLAFSGRQISELRALDINESIFKDNMLIRNLLPGNISLHFNLAPDLPLLMADLGQMEQVVMNLVLNARDAMPQGGELTIRSEEVFINHSRANEEQNAKAGKYVQISVRDTGLGMSQATQDRIFEPFFTTKPIGKGTGLGMSAVFGIVQQHDGFVKVESRIASGTNILVYFPLPEQVIADELDLKAAENSHIVRSGTILVVDDNADLLEITKTMLSAEGYEVITATDGVEALSKYARSGSDIELIILDVVMPGMGGREVFDSIRAEHPRQNFLFITGHAPDGVYTDFIISEKLPLLQKPYTRVMLCSMIRSVLEEASAHSRAPEQLT